MIVIGIDPGLADVGIAAIQTHQRGCTLLYVGSLKTSTKRSLDLRLSDIAKELGRIRRRHTPELIVVEEQAGVIVAKTRTGETNAASLQALVTVGMTCAEAQQCRATWAQLPARTIKKFMTGDANADKTMVRRAILSAPSRFDLSKLPKTQTWNEHKTDAVATACAGAHFNRMRRLTSAAQP